MSFLSLSCTKCMSFLSWVTDRAVLREIREENPLLRGYLGSIDNPELIVYRVTPQRIRFMREWALQYHEVPTA
jgi:hypothetical protein